MTSNLTLAAFREKRLQAQGLLDAVIASPIEAVAWMGAVQAQDFNAAIWAVGIRAPGSSRQVVLEAFNRGTILRTHVMRPTWHFVSAQDIRWMCELSAKRIKSALQTNDTLLGIPDTLHQKACEIIHDVLKGGKQLSAKELALFLEEEGIDTTGNRTYHFFMNAEAEALICSGTLQGSTQTYALLDERVAPQAPVPRDEAIARLARAYLRSHAPATLEDFVWWSGLGKIEARAGFEALEDAEKFEFDGREYYALEPLGASNQTPAKLREAVLLPAFDEYLIAYCDRTPTIAKEHQPQAFTSNGIFRPTIVAQGRVVGTWHKGSTPRKPLELSYFKQPSKALEKQVAKAIARFQAF